MRIFIITDVSIKYRYMSNPRLVMSLLMRVLKLDGMVAVTLGQEEPLFDLRVVSLWQDVESGDMARALAVAYLHYAGLDHLNEYHDGNGVLSSVMVRGIKASFRDDKQYVVLVFGEFLILSLTNNTVSTHSCIKCTLSNITCSQIQIQPKRTLQKYARVFDGGILGNQG